MMEMGFMKNTRKVLTSLKPRVSFGITGRSDFDAYKSLSTYNTNGSYLFDGRWVTGYAPSSNANPDLAWERALRLIWVLTLFYGIVYVVQWSILTVVLKTCFIRTRHLNRLLSIPLFG